MLYRFYAPVVALQLFCIYHAYKNNAEQRWYWLILFLPFFGSVIYIYITFFNSKNIRTLEEGVKEIVIDNYRINQLEKERAFSDSHATRIRLADEYLRNGRYSDALTLYRESSTGFMADDPGLRLKILRAYFLNKDFASAIEIGLALESEKSFKNSEERVAYAWALHYSGKSEQANTVFTDMDKSFTNYQQRTEYCKFLMETSQAAQAKEKLEELLEEANHMRDTERKMTRHVIREAKEMYASLAKA